MSFIATAAFILATQTKPEIGTRNIILTAEPKMPQEEASQDRLNEIWEHVDNRVITQLDVWFELGEFPLSASLLNVQYRYEPDNEDTMTNYGWMLENIEQIKEAREVYVEYIKGHPNDADAPFALAFSYSKERDYANVVKILEPTMTKTPHPNSYRLLAKAYERLKRDKDAIRIWELQLKAFPGDQTVMMNIKRVKARMGGK